jgi:phenylpropionate dioxygenase-like ring-hydroxylating dioxygenase large terminal subunit
MFVRNSWYVAALSDELPNVAGARQPFARTIIGEQVVLFRTKGGDVVAFEDRCPHRRMPLSLGRLTEDDKLVCAYHGLTFNPKGTCVEVPGQTSTQGICLRTYPVVERYGFVWIWMGLSAQANPESIFDCSWLERPGWHRTKYYRHVKANYLLLNDNLADLLHLASLHIPSGAGNESMGPAQTELEVTGTGYHFVRETLDIPSPHGFGRLSNVKRNVDRWHIVDYLGPSFFRIHTGVAETGTGGPQSTLPQGQGRWTIAPHHLITPETETTMHYYMVIGHEWKDSPESDTFSGKVMDEDVWAVENQQRNIDFSPLAPTTAIPSDAAMFAMRKIVGSMLLSEASSAPAMAARAT